LAVERLLAAEKDGKKIAVEIKTFLKPSAISEFHTVLGQFLNYRFALNFGTALLPGGEVRRNGKFRRGSRIFYPLIFLL